jgi:hypothetical protein
MTSLSAHYHCYTWFFLKIWQRAREARCHLLHMKKKQKNDNEPGKLVIICIVPIYKLYKHTQKNSN